ncbi:hypothetical protein L1887_11674 [Cichorium endivia]|nr:hypothetical protein L1887_11674 [Cichorium endivia]
MAECIDVLALFSDHMTNFSVTEDLKVMKTSLIARVIDFNAGKDKGSSGWEKNLENVKHTSENGGSMVFDDGLKMSNILLKMGVQWSSMMVRVVRQRRLICCRRRRQLP